MLKKIGVEHLRVGMHLEELCGSWMEHPFWRTKFVIKDPKDIRLIIESGIKEVWIDIDKGLDIPAAASKEQVEAKVDAELMETAAATGTPIQVSQPKRVAMTEEVKRAAKICANGKDAVVSMFQEVRMGKAISAEAAGELVDEISSSVARNPGALISLARLKTADDYTYMHSVAVCALMVVLARQLNLDEKETREAGMSGLLHDLGKAMMPMEVLNKPGKLTDEEFRIIKSHPEEGHRLLVEGGTAGPTVLDVCLHHHEKVDGSGYPHRLKDEQISVFAKMGAVCDVYDAITSNRPYKSGWDPAESIRKMTEWTNGHFDGRIFQAFVKSIGIYPVGSLVRLSSGRLGVVAEQSDKSLLTPRIKVFFSTKSMAYVPPELIDLSRPNVSEKIVAREDAEKWGIKNLDQYWAA
ncbi:HD-GYP domain-containing protein [Sulfuritalea hydrogenivorans]|jgi:HD-GYP domain-containing protein (c-di-GMP phosphodiesterase class II)|uniref:Metal dependent phosphohydrolase n=1 Tax=Sulfuritalea hydrogenivorans sk43H TaxID=1223802 RepID=W0SK17_9PROT|nr:HD-GYP domain-containing protein [Sulfuritalea hydrogenivorans]BAO31176.1 metal dependent phosphohydrolase [Sulfuritalea hydrogenivorans sk43H]